MGFEGSFGGEYNGKTAKVTALTEALTHRAKNIDIYHKADNSYEIRIELQPGILDKLMGQKNTYGFVINNNEIPADFSPETLAALMRNVTGKVRVDDAEWDDEGKSMGWIYVPDLGARKRFNEDVGANRATVVVGVDGHVVPVDAFAEYLYKEITNQG